MRPILLITLLVILFLSVDTKAQLNDCAGAAVVCSNEAIAFNPMGPGHDDFDDPDNHPGCIVSLEQNTAWYYFQIDPAAPSGLQIGFIIDPLGGLGEDYDWALFGPNATCGNLGSPIRCSSSSAQCGFCPQTGMGMGATDVSEGPGTGDGFVSILNVEPGQGFYLMIDNWLGTMDPFILTWTESAAPYLNCNATPPCALEAIAPAPVSACEGEESIQLFGNSNGNHGMEMYSWTGTNGGTSFLDDPDSQNPTISLPPGFTGSITYTLRVEEDTCESEDMMEIIVYPLPAVTINPAGPFCANLGPQTLSATPTGGVWGGAANGNIFNPSLHGPGIHTVTYRYTDFHGCQNLVEAEIEVYELPTVSISPDPAEFCDSEMSVLLTATGEDGAGGYTFNWLTPEGPGDGPVYDAPISGIYNVTITDANGCTNTGSTTVTSHANPEVEIVDPGPLCETLELYTLNAIPPGGEFIGQIDPSGEMYPNTLTPGSYQIQYYYVDENNCEATDFQTISIITSPESIPSNTGPYCEGQTIQLQGETNVLTGTITYQWSGPNGYSSNQQNPTDATLPGTYVLEVTWDGCISAPATTVVNLIDSPDAFATNTGPYCGNETIVLQGSTTNTGSGISYAWTGPNGFTSTEQNPSNATAPGIYTLVVTQGTCSSPPAQTEVIFGNAPVATATNTGPYCEGESVLLFGNTASTGTVVTYNWAGPNGYTSTQQNPTDVTAPGLYTLIVDVDGCPSAPSNTNVSINALPQPQITGPLSFCTGFSATLDAGTGYNHYEWSTSAQTQMLQVTSSGSYTVTVTDVNGCTGSTSVSVTENASLTPTITGNPEFCEGTSTTLDAGSGYVTYEWSTGATGQSITISDEGNYGVIVTDADGCSGSVVVTAIEHPTPVVTIGGSSTFCIGGFTILDAGNGYTSYQWSNNETTQAITVTTPGNYSVDVIDVYGCAGSGSVSVVEATSLSPIIIGTPAFCENGSTTLNAGAGFATYEWSDGSLNQTLDVNTSGLYSVTVSDGQGCSGESSVMVIEVAPPFAQLTPDTTLCNTNAGGSVIDLYSLIVAGDNTGSWSDVNNSGAVGLFDNLNFNNIPAGDYIFRYTTNSATIPCPEETYDVVIHVMDCTCPDVFFLQPDPLCNSSAIIDLSTIENTAEDGLWSISQSPAGSNPASLNGTVFNATNANAGDYILNFSLVNQPPPGCPLDFEVTLTVDQAVNAGLAAAPVSFCETETHIVNLTSLVTGEDPNGEWTETSSTPSSGSAFNPNLATFNIALQAAGEYTFMYSLQAGGACPDQSIEVTVLINPLPVIQLISDIAITCAAPQVELVAEINIPVQDALIGWTGPGIISGGNTLDPLVDEGGMYFISVTNMLTGCANEASTLLPANTDGPSGALIDAEQPHCFGDQNGFISVDEVNGGAPPYLYSINGQPFSSSPNFNQLPAGQYELIIEDANGCRWDSTFIFQVPGEIILDLGSDIEIGLGESAVVEALVNLSPGEIDTLFWTPNNVIECIDITCLETTVYTYNTLVLSATVWDHNGCKDQDDIMIVVDKTRDVYIPTVFSPNNDGINEIFSLFCNETQVTRINSLRIFNRWGDLLHEALDFAPNDLTKGWNGRYKGDPLNPGVFVYQAEVKFIDGLSRVYYGDVTLVR